MVALPKQSTRLDWSTSARGRAASKAPLAASSQPLYPRQAGESEQAGSLPPSISSPYTAPTHDEVATTGSSPDSTPSRLDESDQLARTALSRFFQNGIDFSDWHVFRNVDDFRLAYVGTTASDLTHLAGLRRLQDSRHQTAPTLEHSFQTNPLLQQRTAAPGSGDPLNPGGGVALHYPYPQIRPLSQWRPLAESLLWAPQGLASDLASFPIDEIREALVSAYFGQIHPVFPVLTPSTFLDAGGKLRKSPPLLLYQAMLLAGAHVCSHPRVKQQRRLLKLVLFRRASMLYHLRHEKDRLHLTQAALLLTWHINDADTVSSGPWYWSGIALRISCGQGAHRHNHQLPIFERIMYKRSFWCAFVSEVFSAFETGRPCSIRSDDIDQSRPSPAELKWDERQDHVKNHVLVQEEARVTDDLSISYHQHIIELAFIVLDVLALNAPSTTPVPAANSIDDRLALWLLRSGLHHDDANEAFYNAFLRMHYNMVVLKLHRNYREISEDSRRTCTAAAESIVTSLERILALNSIGRCHFTVVSAVTSAGIQLVQDVRSAMATGAYLACLNHLERVARMVTCTRAVASFWPNAEAVYKVFEGLQKDYEDQVATSLNSGVIPVGSVEEPEWDYLFAAPLTMNMEELADSQYWPESRTWIDSLQQYDALASIGG